jgi:hypothetical protein
MPRTSAAGALDSRIEDEDLDVLAEAVEVREALERLQALSLEVSEELFAYQQRHARQEIVASRWPTSSPRAVETI